MILSSAPLTKPGMFLRRYFSFFCFQLTMRMKVETLLENSVHVLMRRLQPEEIVIL
jgi:hypothetical protein